MEHYTRQICEGTICSLFFCQWQHAKISSNENLNSFESNALCYRPPMLHYSLLQCGDTVTHTDLSFNGLNRISNILGTTLLQDK